MRLAYYILLLFFSFACATGNAQQPLYRNFTDEDGLPSNTVYQIFQDPKGYLWMTTTKGICRFDGAEFVKIPLEGLQTEDMPVAAMDDMGHLWAANMVGELVYIDNLKYSVAKLPTSEQKLIIKNLDVRQKLLYIKFHDPLLNNTFTKIYNIEGNVLSSYSTVGNLIKQDFYIGQLLGVKRTSLGVQIVVKEGGMFLASSYQNSELRNNQVLVYPKVLTRNDNNIVVCDSDTFLSKGDFIIDQNIPFAINRLYIFDGDELFLINTSDKLAKGVYVSKLSNHRNYQPILKGIKVNKVFKDQSGQFWFACDDKGLICITKVEHKLGLESDPLMGETYIKCLFGDFPKIYIGQNNGFVRIIDSRGAAVSSYNLVNEESVLSFTKMFNNEVAIITKEGNTYHLSRSLKSSFYPIGGLKFFFNFKNEIYFTASSFGIHFSKSHGKSPEQCGAFKPLLNIRSYAISERNDTVLLGTTKGLYGYAHDSVFQFKGFKQPELYITKLYVDTSKTIWICTDGKGLLAYNHEKDIQYFGLKEGLPSLNCSDIVQIDKRRYAVGTDKGLWIYDKFSRSSFLFDKLDGLKSNEITALVSDGTYLWVGTTKGLVKCEIASLQPNPEIPFVEITTAQYEHDGKFSPLAAKLNYQQNHVCFYLSSRSLLAGKKRNYAYRLVGLDTNWVRTSEQKIEFLGLQPGKYRFEVRVFNEDGIGSDDRTFHEFTISPPWWKTTLFYVSMILFLITLALAIGYSYVRNMRKKLQAQYEIKSQINEFKQLALQSQMNPHFIFNSLNAIQSYLSTSDELTAMHFLAKFGRLIRIIFEQSKHKLISIDQEVEGLQHYLDLEKLRFKDKVEYRLFVDPELRARDFMIPPLMVQPIVENSFRHGLFHKKDGVGLLEISFNLVEGRLRCLVRDNGIGRDNSSKINTWKTDDHLSSAISNTSDRLKILDEGTGNTYMLINDLFDESGNPSGTETIIQF